MPNKLKETPKTMTRTKKALQREQTPTSSNFLTPLSNKEETALAHMIGNVTKEELQAHEAVLQEIVSSNLKVTNERLEKLCGKVSNITNSLEFTQKQLEGKTKHSVKSVQMRSFFWSVFFCIRTRENSVFGHFSRSEGD